MIEKGARNGRRKGTITGNVHCGTSLSSEFLMQYSNAKVSTFVLENPEDCDV